MSDFIKITLKILFVLLVAMGLWKISPWFFFLIAFCVLFAKVVAPAIDKMMMKIGEM